MNSLLLLGQKTAEHIGKDAPHRGTVWTGDDAYPGASPSAQHASELLQPEARIRKELQPKLADHRIKGAIREWQRLSVRTMGRKAGSFNRPRALSSIAGAISTPIRCPDAPMVGTMRTAASPVPVHTSRTRSPGRISAALSTSGTKRRDHRPVNPSYADVSTVRPGLT